MAFKRNCTEPISTHSSDDSDKETEISPSFPRFLLIEATGKEPITKLSPFLIQKYIQGHFGTVDSVKKLKSDQLLIETNRKSISEKILKITEFCSKPVKVTPHLSLNSSKGVIRCPDLSGVSGGGDTCGTKTPRGFRCPQDLFPQGRKKNPDKYTSYYFLNTPPPKNNQSWLPFGQSTSLHSESLEMLRLSEIWTS